jgi:hypothetical protein
MMPTGFWAIENQLFTGRLADESEVLMQRATAIKIPRLPKSFARFSTAFFWRQHLSDKATN